MLKGWKPIKCAVGYVMSNKQQCQQFWKVESTQNIITALMLLRVIKKIDFMTLMSSLKALEVQRCGDVSGTVGGSWGWGCERTRVLERLWWLCSDSGVGHTGVDNNGVFWWSHTLELP